jgi:hypothetical protein
MKKFQRPAAADGPRGEKRAGRAGTRDSLIANEGTAEQDCELILILGAGARNQAHQRAQKRNCVRFISPPREFPLTKPA